MINPKEGITSKQLMIFIIATQVGFGILVLPASLAEKVGHDGWITIILSGIIFTLILTLLVLLLNRFKSKAILEINKIVYGSYIGVFLNLIYMLYCYFGGIISLRLFIYVIKISILKLTPVWAIELLVVVPAMYICWYGLKVICRFDSLILLIVPFTLAIVMFIARNMRLDFLLPLNEVGLLNCLKASKNTIVSFLGAELIVFIYPYIKDKKNVMKFAVLANICTLLFYCVIVTVTTAFFGEKHLRYLLFAIFRLGALYRIPIVERLDLILLQLWIFAMYSSMLAYFYCAYNSIQKIFKMKKGLLVIIIFFIGSILLGRMATDFNMVMLFQNIHGYIGVGLIGFTLITYTISTFRKRCDSTNEV